MILSRKHGTLFVLLASAGAATGEPAQFTTPETAVEAVIAALQAEDRAEVLRIFGPENEDILSTGDRETDREIWGQFLRDAELLREIKEETPGRASLYVGREGSAFPFELAEADGLWSFDGEGAREEIRMRRLDRDELEVIDILGRADEIQAQYRLVDHDGDGVMEFAASILSSPGRRDGLYWPDEPGTEASPYGETIARASLTGYSLDGVDVEPEPLEGYYFVILQGQGPDAPGGAFSYMVGDNMVAGHAVAAFPAIYGETGIMSFMVAEGGVIYEADLGEETLTRAQDITLFNPDDAWTPVDQARCCGVVEELSLMSSFPDP
jgi:hypothetical protein